MQTKNSLITQLKEQITEVTAQQKKKGEKVKRSSEIDQLKEMIQQMTAQLITNTSRKSVDNALASPQSHQIEVLSGEERLDSQTERTEADEDIDNSVPQRGKPINH